MSKHTPAPWKAHFEEAYYVTGPDLGRVAMMMNLKGAHGLGGRRSGDESAANCQLIASAPAMLEALEQMLEAADAMRQTCEIIRGSHPEEDDTYTHEQWAEELLTEKSNAVRAVIRAAKGEA